MVSVASHRREALTQAILLFYLSREGSREEKMWFVLCSLHGPWIRSRTIPCLRPSHAAVSAEGAKLRCASLSLSFSLSPTCLPQEGWAEFSKQQHLNPNPMTQEQGFIFLLLISSVVAFILAELFKRRQFKGTWGKGKVLLELLHYILHVFKPLWNIKRETNKMKVYVSRD